VGIIPRGVWVALLKTFRNQGGFVVEDLSKRSAQEVLDDHLNLDEHFGAEENWQRIVE
jgi:hypothetical protein